MAISKSEFERWFSYVGKRFFLAPLRPKDDRGWVQALKLAFEAGIVAGVAEVKRLQYSADPMIPEPSEYDAHYGPPMGSKRGFWCWTGRHYPGFHIPVPNQLWTCRRCGGLVWQGASGARYG